VTASSKMWVHTSQRLPEQGLLHAIHVQGMGLRLSAGVLSESYRIYQVVNRPEREAEAPNLRMREIVTPFSIRLHVEVFN
jgi:hypothetical protein